MSNKDYAILMARYNIWQNESLIEASETLTPADRQKDRGAFFGSIEKTFSHSFWADQLWMSRFSSSQQPEGGIPQSVNLIKEWESFCVERKEFDHYILNWAKDVDEEWLEGDISWFSGAVGREITKPNKRLVMQLFNHQTHHRGQIHVMLTQAGAKPDDTDIPFMPDRFDAL